MSIYYPRELEESEILRELNNDNLPQYRDQVHQMRYVRWGRSEITSEEFPILYSTGFETCLGLYLLNKKDEKAPEKESVAFLYHILTNSLHKINKYQGFPKLKILSKSLLAELSFPDLCEDTFNMGLVYGTDMESAFPYNVSLIEEGFENLFITLAKNGIRINKDKPSYISKYIILDPKGKGLVLSQNAVPKKY